MLTQARKAPPKERVRLVWSRIFNIEANDSASFLKCAASTIDMAAETRKLVSQLTDDDPQIVLKYFGEVEKTLRNFHSAGGSGTIAWFLSPLKETGMHSLELCASLLSRRRPEPVLSGVADLLDRCRSLMEDVRTADDLDDKVRAFALKHLGKVAGRLEKVHLWGCGPVDEVTNEIVGEIRRRPYLVRGLSGTSVGEKFALLLAALDVALSAAGVGATAIKSGSEPAPSPIIVEIKQVFEGERGRPLELPSAPSVTVHEGVAEAHQDNNPN